jgi:hypothetical protein
MDRRLENICYCGARFSPGARGKRTDLCPKCRALNYRKRNAKYMAGADRRARKAITLLTLVAQAAQDGRLTEWAAIIDWSVVEKQMTAPVSELDILIPV